MATPTCVPALLLAGGLLALAAQRLSLSPPPWFARARARMLRVMTAVLVAASALALALSLVGVNEGTADWSRTLQIGVLASLAVAAVAISRPSGSGQEPL